MFFSTKRENKINFILNYDKRENFRVISDRKYQKFQEIAILKK